MLTTKRTILTLLQESDFEELFIMFSEKDIFKYITPHKNKTENEHIEFLNLKLKQIKDNTGYYWIVRSIDNNNLIGALNLTPIVKTDKIQIGWMIVPVYQQKGLAYETAEAVMNFTINETDFNPIYGVFEEENMASKKILTNLGFLLNTSFTEDNTTILEYVYKNNSFL